MSFGDGTDVQESKSLVCVNKLEGWDISSVKAEAVFRRGQHL